MSDSEGPGTEGKDEPRQDEVPRVPSGLPYLDQILAGGWLRGGVYLVTGPPGTGKTMLGSQFCFSMAERSLPALYVTLLSETHARLMLHMSSLSFFKPELVGSQLFYLSGTRLLKEEGLNGLLEELTRTVRAKGIKAMVIDGASLLGERAGSPLVLREFLQGLSVLCGLTECTTLLLNTEITRAMDVEHSMVDGIISLSAELLGLKAIRSIEVLKFRGSNNIPGRHTFLINQEGVKIYPRWEAVYRKTPEVFPDPNRRLRFGIPSVDAMCHGGIIAYSSTLLLGNPGSGKTLLGLHFLAEGAAQGEKGLYFGFAESGETLLNKTRGVGLDLAQWVEQGMVRLEARAPVETLPDAMVQELMDMVRDHGYTRVFIDGLEPFAKEAIDPERTTRFISALMNALRDQHVTMMITEQTNTLFGSDLHSPIRGAEAIVDNLIFVRFVELDGQLRRMLSVLKMRDSENDPFLREFHITSRGLEVREPFSAMDGMLTGLPRQRRVTSPAPRKPKPRAPSPASTSSPSRGGARPPRARGARKGTRKGARK